MINKRAKVITEESPADDQVKFRKKGRRVKRNQQVASVEVD